MKLAFSHCLWPSIVLSGWCQYSAASPLACSELLGSLVTKLPQFHRVSGAPANIELALKHIQSLAQIAEMKKIPIAPRSSSEITITADFPVEGLPRLVISFCSGSSIRITGESNQNALWSILETLHDYSDIQSISFFHTHPGGDFKLSPSDIKAALAINSRGHYLLTDRAEIPVHAYATALVDGHLVTTHFGIR